MYIHTCPILEQNAYERCRTPETPRICFSDHFSFPLGSPASLEGLSEFKLSDLTDLLLVQRLEDLDSAPKKGFDEDLSIKNKKPWSSLKIAGTEGDARFFIVFS